MFERASCGHDDHDVRVVSPLLSSSYLRPASSCDDKEPCTNVIISSEPLSRTNKDWKLIPSNSVIIVEGEAPSTGAGGARQGLVSSIKIEPLHCHPSDAPQEEIHTERTASCSPSPPSSRPSTPLNSECSTQTACMTPPPGLEGLDDERLYVKDLETSGISQEARDSSAYASVDAHSNEGSRNLVGMLGVSVSVSPLKSYEQEVSSPVSA